MMRAKVFALALIFVLPLAANAGSLKKLSKKLSKDIRGLDNKKVAILLFPYHNGKISSGSSILSERLTTDLVQRGVSVVERRLIKKLLEEQRLSETGIVHPGEAKAIGSILGVDALVTGTLIDMDNGETEINARMIHSGSGEIISAGQASVVRTWADRPRKMETQPKPVRAKKKRFEEEFDPEFDSRPEPETQAVLTPRYNKKKSKGNVLNLSNENFPPSRRIYHGGHKEEEEESYSREKLERAYKDGYKSGYSEGYGKKSKYSKTKKKKKKYKSKSSKRFGTYGDYAREKFRKSRSYKSYRR